MFEIKTDSIVSKKDSELVLKVKYIAFEIIEFPLMLLWVNREPTALYQPTFNPNSHSTLTRNPTLFILSRNLGMGLLFLCFIYYLHDLSKKQEMVAEMMARPAVNDVYLVDMHKWSYEHDRLYRYNLAMVSKVIGNNVELKIGNIVYLYKVSFFKYLTRGAYSGETLLSSRVISIETSQLQDLLDREIIYDAQRPKNGYINGYISTRFVREHVTKYAY